MKTPTRPALRYHGGKWRLAPWIISHFPEHTCYVEPFGGAASVLLRKPPAPIEVYNDINADVVNFFQVLRERPAQLIAALDLTPYSREEHARAQQPADDKLEAARRVYVWALQGYGRAGVIEPGGWRFHRRMNRGKTAVEDWNGTDHLWAIARRLKQVHIESDDALKTIQRFDTPETLFYIDPPYQADTRSHRWNNAAYKHEYTDDDHKALAELLHTTQGMSIVSGYPSPLYDQLYHHWHQVTKPTKSQVGNTRTECLWMNYDPPKPNTGSLGRCSQEH